MTREHCGLEVGYPPGSTPALMGHLRAWRQDGGRETQARPCPQGFLSVVPGIRAFLSFFLVRKVDRYRRWGASRGRYRTGWKE